MAFNNNIIKINRGDTYDFVLNIEDDDGSPYIMKTGDAVYFGLMEPNEPFEHPILAKTTLTYEGQRPQDLITYDEFGNFTITFAHIDTLNLVPGVYYYSVKLHQYHSDPVDANLQIDKVQTIVNRTKFIILE